MPAPSVIDGLKLPVVDDEPGVLETLVDLLYKCDVDTAQDYDTAAEMLSKNSFSFSKLRNKIIVDATQPLNPGNRFALN